jgi:hypothetical protein
MLGLCSSLAGEVQTMEQTAMATAEIDARPFEVEVFLTTGQRIKQRVDPREIAKRVAGFEFPEIRGRTDREALRRAAFTIFALTAAADPSGDGLQAYDTEGRTWVVPHRSIASITFVDPAMPGPIRRTGFRPATAD